MLRGFERPDPNEVQRLSLPELKAQIRTCWEYRTADEAALNELAGTAEHYQYCGVEELEFAAVTIQDSEERRRLVEFCYWRSVSAANFAVMNQYEELAEAFAEMPTAA